MSLGQSILLLLLLLLRVRRWLSPRTSLAPRSGVDELFRLGIMGKRMRRSFDVAAEESVKVGGKGVAARVDVDRGGEGLDV